MTPAYFMFFTSHKSKGEDYEVGSVGTESRSAGFELQLH